MPLSEPKLTACVTGGILYEMKQLKEMSLYPRLVPSVGLEWLDQSSLELLGRLCREEPAPDDGTLESVTSPRVSEMVGVGFVVLETGAQYSGKTRRQLLARWADAGAGESLLSMIFSAQKQRMSRLSFEKGGMVPDFRPPARIGKVGKGRLTRGEVRSLLESLRLCHREYWPLEQLANIVRPYAKATRHRES